MVVGRLKTEVSRLRRNKYGERALNSFQTFSQELNSLKIEMDNREKMAELETQTKHKELEKTLSQQRNIFEEFQHVEGNLKKILTLEREEISKLHYKIEQTIRHEEEIEATIMKLAEEIEKIEKQASETEETLTKGEKKFNTNCVEQAIEYGSQQIFEIYENSEKPSKASMMVAIENILEENELNQAGSRKENFSQLDLQQQLEENQELMVELGLKFNELLFELDKDCVDKERYVEMEKELEEIKKLIRQVQELAKNLATSIEKEKKIIRFEVLEQKHLPQTIEGLKELGQELQIMGMALHTRELTQREVIVVTRELKSNPREMKRKSRNKIQRIETNMQYLERIGHELEAEAERLEYEKQQIGQLNRIEEKQLEKLIEKGHEVEKNLKTASDKILHSNKISLGPENKEREKFGDSANKNLEMKLSISLDQVKSVMSLLIHEAEKLNEMKEEEEQIQLEMDKKDLKIESPM